MGRFGPKIQNGQFKQNLLFNLLFLVKFSQKVKNWPIKLKFGTKAISNI